VHVFVAEQFVMVTDEFQEVWDKSFTSLSPPFFAAVKLSNLGETIHIYICRLRDDRHNARVEVGCKTCLMSMYYV
jgi:hypothetical protein